MVKHAAILLVLLILLSCQKSVGIKLSPGWTITNSTQQDDISSLSAQKNKAQLFLTVKKIDADFNKTKYLKKLQDQLNSLWQLPPVPYPDATTHTSLDNLSEKPTLQVLDNKLVVNVTYQLNLNSRKSPINNKDESPVFIQQKTFIICLHKMKLIEAEITSPIGFTERLDLNCDLID